ncbi:hypothetical protein [Hyphomicrobium sp.]|uniref:hypothetical protein n=1 Tax=Hyphomicrobium sp. TaxID=82 RepID=UPI000FBC2C3C|nr:hypothetical protein [Hyphomicrobium sp.]RUP09107.1 MAG: hypothetical protein EKK38_10735 [Hyphomicrobium sp.]
MVYRIRWFMMAFSMVLALVPFAGITVAALIALVAGCEINDAARSACAAFGFDLSPILSSLIATAGLGKITFPVLGAALILWAVIESTALLFRR